MRSPSDFWGRPCLLGAARGGATTAAVPGAREALRIEDISRPESRVEDSTTVARLLEF
jgi:hypothetical protein